jgi:hypothetical protein
LKNRKAIHPPVETGGLLAENVIKIRVTVNIVGLFVQVNIMSKHSIGLKFAGFEHRWEKKTNIAIILGIIVSCLFYYFKWSFMIPFIGFNVTAVEVALFFLVLIGFCHLIARMGHEGEQHFLKDSRIWRKKKFRFF